MKVLHVPFCFYPDPVGGTEVYVDWLARHQGDFGTDSVIAAPTANDEITIYEHFDLTVYRFPLNKHSSFMLREIYGEGDPQAASHFGRIIDLEKPDVVHLHAFTRGVSLLLAREVKRRGIKLVFTYHTPTVSCQRGTLLRYGKEICDGVLDRRLCTRCTLQGLGLNGMRGKIVSAIPPSVGRALETAHLSGGVWTALRMSQLVDLRHQSFRRLMQEADAVIALCDWVRDLLLVNGVEPQKISLSRHGLAHETSYASALTLSAEGGPLRVAFLGRLDPTKGPDILIRALQSQPNLNIVLDIYGIKQGTGPDSFVDELRALAGNDSRISFFPALPGNQVISALRKYHLLAVPSRWLETGPLVVLEAFAAGIPVIGSDLGGIAELVEDGRNGVLVKDQLPESWADELARLAIDRQRLRELTRAVQQPRSMKDVAAEMMTVYRNLTPLGSIPVKAANSVEALV